MLIRSVLPTANLLLKTLVISASLAGGFAGLAAAGQLREVINIALGDSLNVRSGPGSRFQDIGDISAGVTVDVLGYHKNGTWAQILWQGRKAYVSTKFLAKPRRAKKKANSSTGSWVAKGRYRVTGIPAGDPGLNLRAKATSSGSLIAVLPKNSRLRVLRRSGNSRWVYVVTPTGQRGYVYDKYLTRVRKSAGNTGSGSSAPTCPLPGVFTVKNVSSNDRLQVRDIASTGGNIVGSFGPSDFVAVISWTNNGWAKVSVGQETGFAKGSFLECGGHTTNQVGFPTNLTCFGAEPFWAMNINNNGTIDYRGPNDQAPNVATLQSTNPNTLTNSYPYSFAAVPYSGKISRAICSDGMSGGTYIWGVQVNVPNGQGGHDTVNGCCRMQ